MTPDAAYAAYVANRLSLRDPQRESLAILDRLCGELTFDCHLDPAASLEAVKGLYPHVGAFERDFPSLCFALATGVGKTRLMGAFIAYLHRARGHRHFFVLAPNLTIYEKLIADFSDRGSPKYVFQGIGAFAQTPPLIVTGENYEGGRAVRAGRLFDADEVQINVFNVSKINSEMRGGATPKFRKLSEFIGESYFDYLSGLDDLVLLMDESHRYRAAAGMRAINDLNPVLGLELTATPFVTKGSKKEPFENVVYSYPLAAAIADGLVKEPAVATRENFDAKAYSADELERLKLEDGVRIHEETKVQLEVYAREEGVRRVKPFLLVVARDTAHAAAIKSTVEGAEFFGGRYAGKVAEVHSAQRGEEKDENVQRLLAVEDPADSTEIVVHVDKLKEGWDVTNLYTIVPLRAFNSRVLIEQAIGRGLRLPYGKRTGVPAVDRLTIVAHDKFQEIVDEANRGDSIIRQTVVIGRDVPETPGEAVTVQPAFVTQLIGGPPLPDADDAGPDALAAASKPLFDTETEWEAVRATLEVLPEFERTVRRSADLTDSKVVAEVTMAVRERLRPAGGQQSLPDAEAEAAVDRAVGETLKRYGEATIDVPKVVVQPGAGAGFGYADFDLDPSGVNLQPVSQQILVQHLQDQSRHRLREEEAAPAEDRPEDVLVGGLIDFEDVDYGEHARLLYKLAGQMVAHLRGYLGDEADVRNVLQFHRKQLVRVIYSQLQEQYRERETDYEVRVTRGFRTLRPGCYGVAAGESVRPFRRPVDDKRAIRGMLFGGFAKCLFDAQQFDSDTERRFAVLLEDDGAVEKWVKPGRGVFQIHWRAGADEGDYEPDFLAETADAKYLCEPKRADEVDSRVVQAKAAAAARWCRHATEHASKEGGKPWRYLLIPHDAVDASKTLAGLAAGYTLSDA